MGSAAWKEAIVHEVHSLLQFPRHYIFKTKGRLRKKINPKIVKHTSDLDSELKSAVSVLLFKQSAKASFVSVLSFNAVSAYLDLSHLASSQNVCFQEHGHHLGDFTFSQLKSVKILVVL